MTQIEAFLKVGGLKPCDFCGNEAHTINEGKYFKTLCTIGGCEQGVMGFTAEQSENKWNARAIEPEIRNLLLTLDKAREALTRITNGDYANGVELTHKEKLDFCVAIAKDPITAIEQFNPAIKLVKEQV